ECVQRASPKDRLSLSERARGRGGARLRARVSGAAEPSPFDASVAPGISGPPPFSPPYVSEPVRPISGNSFGRPSQFGARPSGPDAGSTSQLPSLDVPMAPSRPPTPFGPMGGSGGGQIPSDFPYPSENTSAITGGYTYGQLSPQAHATNLPLGAPIGGPALDPMSAMGPMSPAAGRVSPYPNSPYSNPSAPMGG